MADFVFNIAKGRVAELYNRVQTNDPANSALILLVLKTTGLESDATMKDYATVDALLKRGGGSQVAEVANTNYARKTLTDANISAMTVDNVNDRMPLDTADQTWAAIAAGDGWSKIVFAYDNDTTTGTDANLIPLTCHDFVVTPDGSDIVATINDFYRAS